jgi:hypothetical protein
VTGAVDPSQRYKNHGELYLKEHVSFQHKNGSVIQYEEKILLSPQSAVDFKFDKSA